jgi:3-dehydrotetronate 4-kinase
MSVLLGCIADDYTGATDLANMLVRAGLRTTLWFDAAQLTNDLPADAVVVALKTRSLAPSQAVSQSLEALRALQQFGARRFFFKYCSTFDSTADGNIGPVAEALMDALGAEQTIFSPAFPENGRTVYLGHLFVGGQLLSESGMERHPLHPMTDANLLRVLQRQSQAKVALVPLDAISSGPQAVSDCCSELLRQQARLLICDAVADEHLSHLASAIVNWPLVTGSSAIAYWLAEAYRHAKLLESDRSLPQAPHATGLTAVISGSCSSATCRQVDAFKRSRPALALDPRSAMDGSAARAALDWASDRIAGGPVLIYSTMPPANLRQVQHEFGESAAAQAFERTMSDLAQGLVELGVRRLVIAGGETAGAVVQSLGVAGLSIGPEIEPGVPWTESLGEPSIALALKSGNFGSDDFFGKALEMLP